MKNLMIALIPALFTQAAFAMPCDVFTEAYECKSASGKYKLNVRYCGHNSSMTNFSFKKAEFKGEATLANTWNGSFKAYEISLAGDQEEERNVTIEINARSLKGTLTESYRAEAGIPWSVVVQEKILCKEIEDNR